MAGMKSEGKRCGMKKFMMLALVFLLSGCAVAEEETPVSVVVTTTMLQDLVEQIGGEQCFTAWEVTALMSVGVDPHSYQPTAGDTLLLAQGDLLFYHGLTLEGEMGDLLGELPTAYALSNGLSPEDLRMVEGFADPHIWFDPMLWGKSAEYVAEVLSDFDPQNQEVYQENLQIYLEKLAELDQYISERVAEIPESSRVLITAHDAFGYLGQRYGIEVMGIQGIASTTEASTSDFVRLSDYIVTHEIKAVFVETSVPWKNMQALQEAVEAQGFSVALGGALYSDSLGEGLDYIASYKANIDTIVAGLK